jgi:hypothetical protein
LGFEPEPRAALLICGDAVVGDEARTSGEAHSPQDAPCPVISQSETSVFKATMHFANALVALGTPA